MSDQRPDRCRELREAARAIVAMRQWAAMECAEAVADPPDPETYNDLAVELLGVLNKAQGLVASMVRIAGVTD